MSVPNPVPNEWRMAAPRRILAHFMGLLTALIPAVFAVLAISAPVKARQAVAGDGFAQSLIRDLPWRNIGPANMSGRVTDIEAVESNPAIVYVGAASGGVWKSVNAGTTWEPVFEEYGSANIGDIAVFQPNPDIVWVGTGEPCTRNSIGWGDGVYKSTDGGRTFTNMGLPETHIISEIITHPTDPDIVWVAAQGHLWGYNEERGVYRTTDGGRTWVKLTNGLPDDGRTGASDIAIDPSNPDILYAGMWERIRRPYNFESGGPNGGIFKSTDGGQTWRRLTRGLPTGDTGKIGLDVFMRDPRILIATVEHGYQPDRGGRGGQPADPAFADMTRLGSGIYRSEDGGETWQFINRENYRPFYFSHIWFDPNDHQRVFVLAGSAQVSEDGGRTFVRRLENIEGDFHALWIDPNDSNRFYTGNDKGAYVTYDGGFSFVMFDNMDIGQFYAVTADNRDPYYVYGGLQDSGNWGGMTNSRDGSGIFTDHWFKFHSGDGFHTTVDPNDWRTVYTEAQGGSIRRFDAVFRQVGGSITPRPSTIVNFEEAVPGYSGSPNQLSREFFRFNWSAALTLSPHDSKTLLFGGNHLFRSTNRGDTWEIISPDLSKNDPAMTDPASGGLTSDVTGAETHGTIITISESPVRPGLIWVGTDDGNVQITRDDGRTWTNVVSNVPGLPGPRWVSRIEASHFDPATAYVSFDGHRSDDYRPYIYRTADYGATWTDLSAGMPQDEPVYVVKEDLRNPDLLFAGTEFGVYTSIDAGRTWHRLMNGFPTVPVHDLVIHPRENDLIAATHGRSIWILDDISPLQELSASVMAADVHMFDNRIATRWHGISRGATRGHFLFRGRNPLTIADRVPQNSPSDLTNSATIDFWLASEPQGGRVTIEISDPGGENTFTQDIEAHAGINRYFWPMRFDPPASATAGRGEGGGGRGGFGGGRGGPGGVAAEPGSYIARLTVGGRTYTGSISIRPDPDLPAGLR